MKKTIIITAVFALLLTGCATRNMLRHEFDKTYDYDRLYSSVLLAVNDKNFTILEHSKEDGVIKGQDNAILYSSLISIVLAKGQGKTLLSANEATCSMSGNRLEDLVQRTDFFYGRFDRDKRLETQVINSTVGAGTNEKSPQKTGELPVLSSANAVETGTVKLTADIAWDDSLGLSVNNGDVFDWKNVNITLTYTSLFETKKYEGRAELIKTGEKITLKKTLFKSEGGGELKKNTRPDKIELKCLLEAGKAGVFEGK
jgi:hypothetical protein